MICEYNAVLGDLYPVVVPYDPAFTHARPNADSLRRTASHFRVYLLSRGSYQLFTRSRKAAYCFGSRPAIGPCRLSTVYASARV